MTDWPTYKIVRNPQNGDLAALVYWPDGRFACSTGWWPRYAEMEDELDGLLHKMAAQALKLEDADA